MALRALPTVIELPWRPSRGGRWGQRGSPGVGVQGRRKRAGVHRTPSLRRTRTGPTRPSARPPPRREHPPRGGTTRRSSWSCPARPVRRSGPAVAGSGRRSPRRRSARPAARAPCAARPVLRGQHRRQVGSLRSSSRNREVLRQFCTAIRRSASARRSSSARSARTVALLAGGRRLLRHIDVEEPVTERAHAQAMTVGDG
jgi:hypothetical protein